MFLGLLPFDPFFTDISAKRFTSFLFIFNDFIPGNPISFDNLRIYSIPFTAALLSFFSSIPIALATRAYLNSAVGKLYSMT